MEMKIKKYEPKINLGAINIDLDEIPDTIEIKIHLPEKKVPELICDIKKPKNMIALF